MKEGLMVDVFGDGDSISFKDNLQESLLREEACCFKKCCKKYKKKGKKMCKSCPKR